MEKYLEQCKKLSLTARMAIALLVFERFCEENMIESHKINELSDYLWKWPLVDGPEQFEPWERTRPELANYGLGDDATSEILSALEKSQIEEYRFRMIVSSLIEILWGSFWGAAEDELSMEALITVLSFSKVRNLPPLTPFKFSLFKDMNGWGEKITKDDCDYWRGCLKSA